MKFEAEWIPVDEKTPEISFFGTSDYILVSFDNCAGIDIARYEEHDGGGNFYPGDDDKSYLYYGLIVNAWMPCPKRYSEEEEDDNDY